MKKLGTRHKVMQQMRKHQKTFEEGPGIKVNDYINQKHGAIEEISDQVQFDALQRARKIQRVKAYR